jgi:hypothetical protein
MFSVVWAARLTGDRKLAAYCFCLRGHDVRFYLGIYFRHFESLDKTYGPLGAAIDLYVWFYLSGFAILLGGEINLLLGDIRHLKTSAIVQTGLPRNEQSEFLSLSLPLTYANRQSIQNLVSVRRRR